MNSTSDASLPPWLSNLLSDPVLPLRYLVLSRTQSQCAALRRLIAGAGGMLGVVVATPQSLALQCMPGKIVDEGLASAEAGRQEPGGEAGALLRKVAGRVHLLEQLRVAVSQVRLHKAAGGDASALPTALVELAASEWERSEDEEAAAYVLGVLAKAGEVGAARKALGFDKVYSVGWFGAPQVAAPTWEQEFVKQWLPEEGTAGPLINLPLWETLLLELLQAEPLDAATTSACFGHRVAAVNVPDVPAEARLAARLAIAARTSGEGQLPPLVLVPDSATAERFRAACLRNGHTASRAESMKLSRYPLSAAVETMVPWFSGEEDPRIRASHLQKVLSNPMVGQQLPQDVVQHIGESLKQARGDAPEAGEPERARLSSKDLTRAIQEARVVEAPLSLWITQLDGIARSAVSGKSDEDHDGNKEEAVRRKRRALILKERLIRLRQCIRGDTFEQQAPDTDDGDIDGEGGLDEGGDQARLAASTGVKLPARGTLGAMRRFLRDCGMKSFWNDPAGLALLALLKEHAAEAVTVAGIRDLTGTVVPSGLQADGIEVMSYEDYDGRPSGCLLLLGVHNKGLSAAPAPHPFLPEAAHKTLGELAGNRAVKGRILQALRAASRAECTLALLSARDATGRSVVPPVELELDRNAGEGVLRKVGLDTATVEADSLGLGLAGLEETKNRKALSVVLADNQAEVPKPTSPSEETVQLAVQGCAEWFRAGLAPGMMPLPEGEGIDCRVLPLTGLLPKSSEAPEWLSPYLGHTGPGITGRLDDGKPWSVSRHFQPATHCLYQLFGRMGLGLSEPEEVSDALLPSEVGDVVHSTLQHEGQHVAWTVADEQEKEQATVSATKGLDGTAKEKFQKCLADMGQSMQIADAAVAGLKTRWSNRWSGYLDKRIVLAAALEKAADTAILARIPDQPAFSDLLGHFSSLVTDWSKKKKDADKVLNNWLRRMVLLAEKGIDLTSLDDSAIQKAGGQSKSNLIPNERLAAVKAVLLSPEFGESLDKLLETFAGEVERIRVLNGGVIASAQETALPEKIHIGLTWEGGELSVAGRIDEIRVRQGTDQVGLEIVDYKSGAVSEDSDLQKGLVSLRLPQLPVYALALQSAVDGGKLQGIMPDGSRVVALAYDYLKADKPYRREFSESDVASARAILSDLVARAARGEFLLHPHPCECPVLLKNGGHDYCPLAGACRFRDHARQLTAEDAGGETNGEGTEP